MFYLKGAANAIKQAKNTLRQTEANDNLIKRKTKIENNDKIFSRMVEEAETIQTNSDNVQSCSVECERVSRRIRTHFLQIQLGLRILQTKKGTTLKWREFALRHLKMLRSRWSG